MEQFQYIRLRRNWHRTDGTDRRSDWRFCGRCGRSCHQPQPRRCSQWSHDSRSITILCFPGLEDSYLHSARNGLLCHRWRVHQSALGQIGEWLEKARHCQSTISLAIQTTIRTFAVAETSWSWSSYIASFGSLSAEALSQSKRTHCVDLSVGISFRNGVCQTLDYVRARWLIFQFFDSFQCPVTFVPYETAKLQHASINSHRANQGTWCIVKDVFPGTLFGCTNNIHLDNSKDQAQSLLLKCAGIDNTPIEDDLGGLPKTVSVEDSFRRGTVTTRDAVIKAANDVCSRLPVLLHERSLVSNNTLLAYPTTLRLTVRLVIDPNDPSKTSRQPGRSRRRPFETFSKQIPFPGKSFVKIDESQKPELLYQNISGMLRALVLDKPCFDVTRLNLAATNFGDLDTGSGVYHGSPSKQRSLSQTVSFFTQTQHHSQVLSQPQSQPTLKDRKKQVAAASMAEQVAKGPGTKQSPPSVAKYKSVAASASSAGLATEPSWSNKANLHLSDLDPTVLNELPPDVRAEILKSFPPTPFSRKKRTRIDDFFQPVNSKK